jgi:hypothetical protein
VELSESQEDIRTLVAPGESEALVISCYLNVEARVQRCRNALAQRAAVLRRSIGKEDAEAFEQGLSPIVGFIKDGVAPGSKGVAAFARRGSQPFSLPLEFNVPLPPSIAIVPRRDSTSHQPTFKLETAQAWSPAQGG